MKNYQYLENYCQNGDLGINKNVFKEELQKEVESIIYANLKLLCDADEKSVDIKLVFDIK